MCSSDLANPEFARERLMKYVPMGRYGKPEEIAELVFFLASTAPAFLTGETIIIDGGYTAH